MAILIDSYGKENLKDFTIYSGYISIDKSIEVVRNIIGIITNKYCVMNEDEIKLSNSNKCEYIVNGVPIWVTAKPLNKPSIKKRLKDVIGYITGTKQCLFYYKDYDFNMDKIHG